MTSTTLDSPATLVPLKQDAAVIGLVGLAHASSHFGHLLLPLLFPVFMTEFGLSYSQLGLLMSVFLWCRAWARPVQALWWTVWVRGL